MSVRTILFTEGALVDSTYAHVEAWHAAFAECGIMVPRSAIHRRIGMPDGLLVFTLFEQYGADHHDAAGLAAVVHRVTKLQTRFFLRRAAEIAPTPGAQETLHDLHRRGYTTVLATATTREDNRLARAVLSCDDVLDTIITADDIDPAEPGNAFIRAALDRGRISARNTVVAGSTIWDAAASIHAGIAPIAVRSSGFSDADLFAAGYTHLVDTPRELSPLLESTSLRGEAAMGFGAPTANLAPPTTTFSTTKGRP